MLFVLSLSLFISPFLKIVFHNLGQWYLVESRQYVVVLTLGIYVGVYPLLNELKILKSTQKHVINFIYSTKTFNYNLRSNFVKIDFHLLARSDMCFHLHLCVHCLVSICVKSRKKSSRSFVFVRALPSIPFICCPQSFWQLTRTWVQSPVMLPISLCGRFGLSSVSFGHRTMCFLSHSVISVLPWRCSQAEMKVLSFGFFS